MPTNPNPRNLPLADGEPGNYIQPLEPTPPPRPGVVPPGGPPNNPFPPPAPVNPPQPESKAEPKKLSVQAASADPALRLSPRIGPQPVNLPIKPGEEKLWNVVGMDLDGLTAAEILLHFDPRSLDVSEVLFGSALAVDPKAPPVATIDRNAGTVRISSTDGKPLTFNSGGEVVSLRVHGGLSGDTFLVMENPDFHSAAGTAIVSAVSGGRAKVE